MRTLERVAAALLLSLTLTGCLVAPDQAPATPQRPTLSSDTSTTATGTIELETGTTIDPGDAYAFPTTLKWGSSDHTELQLGFSPWTRLERPGQEDAQGTSDLLLGVRHRVADQSGPFPSAAVQATAKLPTANREIGTGQTDVLLAGIATRTFGPASATGFYQLGVLGDPDGRGTDLSHDLAVAGSVPVAPQWSAFGELAASLVPDQHTESVFATGGATFAWSPGIVFDAGMVVGLSEDAPDLQLVAGVTYNFGSLIRVTAAALH